MKTSYNYELIEDYLDGILSSEATEEVAKSIESDEFARDIAKGILLMREEFGSEGKVEEYLNSRLKSLTPEMNQEAETKRSFPILKIAASIILVSALGLTVYQLSKTTLEGTIADQLETPYKASVAMRGNDSSNAISEALQAFNEQNYSQAISLLRTEDSAQSTFFLGLSLLYSNETEKAISFLGQESLRGSRFEEQSRWYLSLAYLKNGELNQAEKLLLRIKHTEGHYQQSEALSLLEILTD